MSEQTELFHVSSNDGIGFISAARSTEEIPVPPLQSEEGVSVSLQDRAYNLAAAMDEMAEANKLKGALKAQAIPGRGQDLRQRYGNHLEGILGEVNHKANRDLTVRARMYFAKAGGYAVTASGLLDHEGARDFGKFYAEYYGTQSAKHLRKDRLHYRKVAEGKLSALKRPAITEPEEPVNETELAVSTDTYVLPMPESRKRLRAIAEDKAAGFLPTTNREKVQALALLDYLGNPQYRLGADHQLQEIADHQMKGKTKAIGEIRAQDAKRSIVYEWNDYRTNALTQSAALEVLKVFIDNCPNPAASLQEELDAGYGPGFAGLVRYLDLEDFMSGKNDDESILRTVENRGPQSRSDKNKTVEDIYTGALVTEQMQLYIKEFVNSLTVGELRDVVVRAIDDQKSRSSFWEKRMLEARGGKTRDLVESLLSPAAA